MSTTSKTTTPKAPAQKTATATKAKNPPASSKPEQAAADGPFLRKKDLIEAVVRRSGVKKKDAKPVVEAMLAELGETLAAGRELNLPPLGRIRINREKPLDDGRVIILKLRQKDLPPLPKPAVTAAE